MKIRWLLTAVPISLFLTLSAGGLRMQTVPPSGKAAASIAKPAAPSDEDLDAMRERLFRLLRISPKLTMVVARDPSLLAGSIWELCIKTELLSHEMQLRLLRGTSWPPNTDARQPTMLWQDRMQNWA